MSCKAVVVVVWETSAPIGLSTSMQESSKALKKVAYKVTKRQTDTAGAMEHRIDAVKRGEQVWITYTVGLIFICSKFCVNIFRLKPQII